MNYYHFTNIANLPAIINRGIPGMPDTEYAPRPDASVLLTPRRSGENLSLCRGRVGDRLPNSLSSDGTPNPIPVHFDQMRVRITVDDSMFFPVKWQELEQVDTDLEDSYVSVLPVKSGNFEAVEIEQDGVWVPEHEYSGPWHEVIPKLELISGHLRYGSDLRHAQPRWFIDQLENAIDLWPWEKGTHPDYPFTAERVLLSLTDRLREKTSNPKAKRCLTGQTASVNTFGPAWKDDDETQ